jgi:hypothetical protein
MNTRYYPANPQWFFVHPRRGEMLSPPLPGVALLGVASTLRRVKSKAPALHYRAESPAINSTGQRPVWKGHSLINKPQRGGIKSNNRISPRKGEISVARRCNAGDGKMPFPPERRSPDLFLYTTHETNRIRLSDKIYRGFAAGGFIADNPPALKRRATHISPFQGYGVQGAFIHRALPCAIDNRAFSPTVQGWSLAFSPT